MTATSRHTQLATLLIALVLSAPALAETVVFSENFGVRDTDGIPSTNCDPDFPVGWVRHNVDGKTPNAQIAWMENQAWIVREDYVSGNTSNCVAFSTSYYEPVGASDDWMVTPAIAIPTVNPRLRFRARASDPTYRDGYEVRWATTNDVAALSANSALLTVAAENVTWTTREIDLAALAGQTVHLAFRNNSSDKFLLLLDDVQVVSVPDHDAAITTALRPHASLLRVPVGQAQPLQLGARVRNAGSQALSNVVVTAHVKLDGAEIHTVSAAAVASLAADASADVSMTPYTVTQTGTVTVEYTLSAAEGDDNPANDTLTSDSLEITELELGADDGNAIQKVGIGAAAGGQLGTVYHLSQAAYVRAIRYYSDGTSTTLAGDNIVGEIWSTGGSPPKPVAQLAQTLPHVVPTPTAAGYVDLPLATPLLLTPGDYYFGLIEPVHDANENDILDLGVSRTLYQPGRNWVRFLPNSPDWVLLESFGVTWERAPLLRVLLAQPANLSATKTVSGNLFPGGDITYTVVLHNSGDLAQSDNSGDELMDVLPAGLTLTGVSATAGTASSTGNTVRWNGSVAPGGSVTLSIAAKISPATLPGSSISNQASLTFDADGNGSNESSALSDDPSQPGASDPTAFVVQAAPVVTTFTDPALAATVSGGGASCGFAHAQVVSPSALPAPPNGVSLVSALLDFRLSGCDTSPVTVTLSYAQPLPAGAGYWKYHAASDSWARFTGGQVAGSTVTLTLQDGGAGDDDGEVNGSIVDPGAAALRLAAPVPVDAPWALALLASLLSAIGLHRRSAN